MIARTVLTRVYFFQWERQRGERPHRSTRISRHCTIKTAAALIFVTLSLAACASAPRPEFEWVKLRDSAEDFKPADQECQKRAFAATAGEYIQSTATKAALGVYLTCMKDKGWTQVQRGQPTPTNNP